MNLYTEEAENLAAQHWAFIHALLDAHGEQDDVKSVAGFHYLSAFVHGWKHAMEFSAAQEPLQAELAELQALKNNSGAYPNE